MEQKDLNILMGIDTKIDNVKDKIHSIEVTQIRMEGDLKYHIKRTDLLEQKVFEIDDKIKPVETAKNATTGLFKFIAFFLGLGAAIVALFKNFK